MKKPTDKKAPAASKIAPRPNRIIKSNSPKREAELNALRQKIDAEKPTLMIEAKAKLKEARTNRAELASIFASLKAEREKLGLSLAEMSDRCGMAREVIYRLESQTTPNPTIGTIQRYATAVGLEVSFALKRIAKAIGQDKPNNDAIVAD